MVVLLGEVGEVLECFGDERERATGGGLREFVAEFEEAWREDGGTEEAEEDEGRDESVA